MVDKRKIAVATGGVVLVGLAGYLMTRKVEAKPEDIMLSNLTIFPPEVFIGESVEISLLATNRGNEKATKEITCEVLTRTKKMVTLDPGESKTISFQVIPTELGVHQVTVDGLVGYFYATEIPAAKFYVPSVMSVSVTDGTHLDMYWRCSFSVIITNKGEVRGTHNITWQDQYERGGSAQITLNPGESYTWSTWWFHDFRRLPPPLTCELWGDWEQDNYSKGEAWP